MLCLVNLKQNGKFKTKQDILLAEDEKHDIATGGDDDR